MLHSRLLRSSECFDVWIFLFFLTDGFVVAVAPFAPGTVRPYLEAGVPVEATSLVIPPS